jgi:hypothetical protein
MFDKILYPHLGVDDINYFKLNLLTLFRKLSRYHFLYLSEMAKHTKRVSIFNPKFLYGMTSDLNFDELLAYISVNLMGDRWEDQVLRAIILFLPLF